MEINAICCVKTMLKWTLLSVLFTVCYGQICDQSAETLSPQTMKEHLFVTAVPRGRVNAGYFEHDLEADEVSKCLISCCDKPLCNIAWFTQHKCFTIECDEKNRTARDPVPQSGAKYNDTVLIQVRSIEKTRLTDECSLLKNGCDSHQKCKLNSNNIKRCVCQAGYARKNNRSKECVPVDEVDSGSVDASPAIDADYTPCEYGVTLDCGPHRECVPINSRSNAGVCLCLTGYIEDYSGKCVVDNGDYDNALDNALFNSDNDNSEQSTNKDFVVCEFGVTQCGVNRECVQNSPKSRSGTCECVKGYVEDVHGKCVVDKNANTDNEEEVTSKTDVVTVPAVRTSTSKPTEAPTQKQIVTTQKVEMLTVSVGDNKQIQLPVNEVTLTAFVVPEPANEGDYKYDWIIEAHPEAEKYGTMEGHNTKTLKLKELIVGLYTFRVQVTGSNKFGEASVNVTVSPPARENTPPIAVITPTSLQIKLPNSAILDGSDSTDDDKIVNYHWDVVSGPLQDNNKIIGDTETIKIQDLVPGNYTFKLTVTDSDGATNSTTANVTVIKETDYPPKANAGSDIVIHLPQTSVVLYGNQSTDDKGIVSYEWIKKASEDGAELAVDVQGARTPELHLSNLEVGDYTFTLKVTDAAQQVSTADVHVFVKPEQNTPPVAKTEDKLEISLPLDNILLNGSASTDDQMITSFLWQQTGGPTVLTIEDADKSIATAGGSIHVGKYTFKLTVKDKEEKSSSAVLTVNIIQVQNERPVANAGGDRVIQLPQTLLTIDGSKSTDDHKITEYLWTRDPKSLAAGTILNNSDHQAILQLVNLVAGKYIFTLTVTDVEGLTSADQTSILVKPAEHEKDLLELTLNADITDFTQESLERLKSQLSLLLPREQDDGDTVIDVQSITEEKTSGNLRILFYALNVKRDVRVYRNGVETLKVLKKKLLSSPYITEYKVITIDTQVCQNNCSNHGHCDLRTKLCVCEAFWTQNIFTYYIHGDSNCDWSILYVVIVCFLIVISCTGAMWACYCCWEKKRCPCYRCKRWKSKKRHRYSLLKDAEDEIEATELKNSTIQNSSVMISESDFSSEEETLFVNQKKTNGHVGQLNGVNKQHLKTTMKT